MMTRSTAHARRLADESRVLVDPAGVSALLPSLDPDRFPTSRDLLLQGLLHLPRIASSNGEVDIETARDELDRLHALRVDEIKPYKDLAATPPAIPTISEIDVRVIHQDDAEPIASHFHYLRSFRRDSVYVAAVAASRIVALCSISPFDLPHIAGKLVMVSPDEVAVVSRVFAFDWAPRNTISFMLARAEALTSTRMLLTYLNPNMGFTGASYKAANWQSVGFETGTRYAYLNARYTTDRQLSALPPEERLAVQFSRMRLLPLELYGRVLDRRLIPAYTGRAPFVVARPPFAWTG